MAVVSPPIGITMPTFRTNLAVVLALAATLALLAAVKPAGAEAFCNFQNVVPGELTGKQARQSVHCLINEKRNQHGRGDYSSDGRLVKAAAKHSRVMAEQNCFSHECPGEPSLKRRLRNVGYITNGLSAYAYGENIGKGDGELGRPKRIVNAWMQSPPHRRAILSGKFKEMGAGFASRGITGFYTVDFGFRRR